MKVTEFFQENTIIFHLLTHDKITVSCSRIIGNVFLSTPRLLIVEQKVVDTYYLTDVFKYRNPSKVLFTKSIKKLN